MALITFSWRTQKGFGLLMVLFGWALAFQILSLQHGFEILQIGTGEDDWMVFLGVIVAMSVSTAIFMASIYENFFEPLDEKAIVNLHTVVLATFIIWIIGYFGGIQLVKALEPFYRESLTKEIIIEGWNEFLYSQIIGFFCVFTFWGASEKINVE
ncbi:MAG: hypothetical protein ACXAC7_00475 [Candidatus Hodarchaeales archaeon]|jgi:hypothetical protein